MDDQVKEKETAKESSMLFWVKLQTCLTGAVLALLLIVGIFAAVQVGHVCSFTQKSMELSLAVSFSLTCSSMVNTLLMPPQLGRCDGFIIEGKWAFVKPFRKIFPPCAHSASMIE